MTDTPDIVRVSRILKAGKAAGIEPVAGESLSQFSDRILEATAQQHRSPNTVLILRIALTAIAAATGIVVI